MLRGSIHLFLVMLLVAAFNPVASAKEIPTVKPEREGFSSERLQRITQAMNAQVEQGIMVGGQGLVARNGKIVYQANYGMADREAAKPMQDDTLFRIYSMTKPITSVAVMMLYEEGLFLLDDPVAKYLPELADLEVAMSTADSQLGIASDGTVSRTTGEADEDLVGKRRKPVRQPTIRDLLMHTAGFTYGVFGNTEVDQLYRQAQMQLPQMTVNDLVAALGKLPLQYDPGTRWHYSVSVDVQGALVERVSGMTFGEFLRTRIFEPLDMSDTFFFVPPEKLDRLAQLYSPKGTKPGSFMVPPGVTELEPSPPMISAGYMPGAKFESGGAGLVSTLRDYLRFSQMLLNGGELDGVRVLGSRTVDLMTRNHLGDISMGNNQGWGFGLGFGVVLEAGAAGEMGSAGEYNWGGAAGTRFWIDPVENIIGIFMVQSIPHRTQLREYFKVLTYQALID